MRSRATATVRPGARRCAHNSKGTRTTSTVVRTVPAREAQATTEAYMMAAMPE